MDCCGGTAGSTWPRWTWTLSTFATLILLSVAAVRGQASKSSIPRIKLSYQELQATNSTWSFGGLYDTESYHPFLMDEERGQLYLGSRDYLFALNLENISSDHRKIFWPSASEWKDDCRAAGKDPKTECGNYAKVLHHYNQSHLLACGTGAFHPVCNYVGVGRRARPQDREFHMDINHGEGGKWKSPFDPTIPIASILVEGELFSGMATDFMSRDFAIIRSLGSRHSVRTEQDNSRWLNEPKFVSAFWVPESDNADDDKVYFFLRETALEGEFAGKATYSRIAQLCRNDMGGQRSLVNKWTTFLKARIVCSVPGGGEGVDTQFNELQDIFMMPTRDPKNPIFYGVFTTSSPIFQGSAICQYTMADIRRSFLGPFAHKEGPNYQWVQYQGKVPYPRPGTCPSKTFGGFASTHEYPDEVLSFVRSHPLMFSPVHPSSGQPIVVRTNVPYRLTRIAVDHVEADDGAYDVMFIGTDVGTVLKVVLVPKQTWQDLEEVTLEEVQVFKEPMPILSMAISPKRQQLYVGSETGVTQLALQRCGIYGKACAECCLSRDPYCAWDGHSCSRYFPSNKRRSRRQDIRNGDPMTQCSDQFHNYNPDAAVSGERAVYGVQNSSMLLECAPRSRQARVFWLLQKGQNIEDRQEVIPSDRASVTEQGLLLRALQPGDSGLYLCKAEEHGSFVQTLARFSLYVLDASQLEGVLLLQDVSRAKGGPGGDAAGAPGHRSWYRDVMQLLNHAELRPGLRELCERSWWRRQQQQQQHRPRVVLPPGTPRAHLQPRHVKSKQLRELHRARNRRTQENERSPRSV
nr:semaphorin-3A-like isoform X2 [Petromyzon marinus]XP_032822497.1 semaphorin-3A-like isoform X2 [Petromyzon marinus]XP_032822498.1 semaphorin-3A-like isoform X2 [Petromyzon marinus]XP_032822499.1 semaphorin-3A-like isoform X2 [Petromyzon marinus]XP_032822500.1 semaphorin-3A-like isoform X2 [Petromyzon marinus]XP_032822501.1 semaphorin-3A-like isoform X2 [Petromyzon marinus]XP_032822502.1 semaphorin-3A-like isoform X2 [Petromyzon marinus]XP_032822503.1 semaphorin-3A-like isoform X2 [Petromy